MPSKNRTTQILNQLLDDKMSSKTAQNYQPLPILKDILIQVSTGLFSKYKLLKGKVTNATEDWEYAELQFEDGTYTWIKVSDIKSVHLVPDRTELAHRLDEFKLTEVVRLPLP